MSFIMLTSPLSGLNYIVDTDHIISFHEDEYNEGMTLVMLTNGGNILCLESVTVIEALIRNAISRERMLGK